MSQSTSSKQKAPTKTLPSLTPDPEDDEDVMLLKWHIYKLQAHLDQLANHVNQNTAGVNDHLTQLDSQVVASAPASSSAIKIPKAEPFEGNWMKLQGFLTQMNMQINVNKSQLPWEADRVIFVSTYLRGQAWSWFEPYIHEYYEQASEQWSMTTREIFTSYAKFWSNLEQTFGDIDTEIAVEWRLKRLQQTTTALTYSVEFLQIISSLNWHEKTYISIYIGGLKGHIKDKLAKMDWPDMLDKAIEISVRIDSWHMEWQLEKQEVESWKQGQLPQGIYQSNEKQNALPWNQGYSDPYGPRPMELDATQQWPTVSMQEKEWRLKEKCCFTCEKSGHMRKDCQMRQQKTQSQWNKTKQDRKSVV